MKGFHLRSFPPTSQPLASFHDLAVRSPFLGCRPLRRRSGAPRGVAGAAGAGMRPLGGLAVACRPLRQTPPGRIGHRPAQPPAPAIRILLRLVSTPSLLLPMLRFD